MSHAIPSRLYVARTPAPTRVPTRAGRRPSGVRVAAVGRLDVGSCVRYVLGWVVVLLAVWMTLFVSAYLVLRRTGVLRSLSESLASLLDLPLDADGLISAFTWTHALAVGAWVGLLLATAWCALAVGAVLVHNSLCRLGAAPRLELRYRTSVVAEDDRGGPVTTA